MWVSLLSADLFCTQMLNWVRRGKNEENAAFFKAFNNLLGREPKFPRAGIIPQMQVGYIRR